jgi:hypothetical protein
VNAFGSNAAQYNTGDYVNAFGWNAAYGNTGSNSTFIGANPNYSISNLSDYHFEVYGINHAQPLLMGDISTAQVSIGTRTLCGALNVSGLITVNNVQQPIVQVGSSNAAGGDVAVSLPFAYTNTSYYIGIQPYGNPTYNVSVGSLTPNTFTIETTGTFDFAWTTAGF